MNREATIANFLSWYLASSDYTHYGTGGPTTSLRNSPFRDLNVETTLSNNGFNQIPQTFAYNFIKMFVNDKSASTHPYSIEGLTVGKAGVQGCSGVTGGAN